MAEYRQVFKVSYRVITPVHIGTGEDISPFEYVIKDGKLYRIESDELIPGLSEEQLKRFYAYVDENNLVGLRDVVIENFNKEAHAKYEIKVTQSVAEKYERNILDVRNQLLISPFTRSKLDFKPYIPGSSIKGAIRTAIIDSIVKEKIKAGQLRRDVGRQRDWELGLLNAMVRTRRGERTDARRDPFRVLKVADVKVLDEFFSVGEVLNAKVDEKRGRITTVGIQMFKEVLLGEVNLNRRVEFEGEIRIDEILSEIKYKGAETGNELEKWIRVALTKESIIKSCNDFYLGEFKREREFFESVIEMTDVLDKIERILKPASDEFVIRVGRFSGFTAVTVNEIRERKNPKTKNLFDGKYPMGWIKVKFLS